MLKNMIYNYFKKILILISSCDWLLYELNNNNSKQNKNTKTQFGFFTYREYCVEI